MLKLMIFVPTILCALILFSAFQATAFSVESPTEKTWTLKDGKTTFVGTLQKRDLKGFTFRLNDGSEKTVDFQDLANDSIKQVMSDTILLSRIEHEKRVVEHQSKRDAFDSTMDSSRSSRAERSSLTNARIAEGDSTAFRTWRLEKGESFVGKLEDAEGLRPSFRLKNGK